jgi:hypothetical protein
VPFQTWVETLAAAQGDGTALTASTAETSLLPAQAKITLPPNYFDHVGQSFEILAMGRCSTVVTTPGTLTLKAKLGSTVLVTTGAITLTTTAQTNDTWSLRALGTVRSVGSGTAANAMTWGQFTSGVLNNSVTAPADWLFPNTAPAVGSGFDSTVSNILDFTAQWSLSNANSIQLHGFLFKALN